MSLFPNSLFFSFFVIFSDAFCALEFSLSAHQNFCWKNKLQQVSLALSLFLSHFFFLQMQICVLPRKSESGMRVKFEGEMISEKAKMICYESFCRWFASREFWEGLTFWNHFFETQGVTISMLRFRYKMEIFNVWIFEILPKICVENTSVVTVGEAKTTKNTPLHASWSYMRTLTESCELTGS